MLQVHPQADGTSLCADRFSATGLHCALASPSCRPNTRDSATPGLLRAYLAQRRLPHPDVERLQPVHSH